MHWKIVNTVIEHVLSEVIEMKSHKVPSLDEDLPVINGSLERLN